MRTVPYRAGGATPRLSCRRWAGKCVQILTFSLLADLFIGSATPARADSLQDSWAKIGQASWYGQEFDRRLTASGERFDPGLLTGAHRTLPLGSRVRVTNLHNGRSVLVTINDRGPYFGRREIDLSYGAARVLGMLHRGVARVRIELVES